MSDDHPERPRHRLRLEDSQELLQHAGEEVGKGARKMWWVFLSLQNSILFPGIL
jgi:large conductance mechanosensitive channel